ncbi:MAG: RNA methyltransferase [Saprospiraceae bacterium]|nr:RNA methyltransferase [Saprospiraceae bacterium]
MRKIPNEELGRWSEAEFESAKRHPIVFVLDNVRSMHNVGAAFRTADGFGIEKIYLCGITAKPPHRDINKAALGATETIEWEHYDQTLDAIAELKEKGYTIVSVEQVEGSTSLERLRLENNQKIALVFGHEVKGVDQEVVNQSDFAIEIPQFGTKHSFNISVSIGIVTWEIIKQELMGNGR